MKVAVTGADGFLGSALIRKLEKDGHGTYKRVSGDVRDPDTFSELDESYDMLYHFAAPSSQLLFKRNPAYCIETTLKGFMNAAEACRRNGIKLVYPSTGVLSQGSTNEYARCKQICEDYHLGSGLDALGLRIFATYGPGEEHKRDYASVPYLFASDVLAGRVPVVYGDGKQTRDFIHIDDCVNAIYELSMRCGEPIVDVGSGKSTSFVDLIEGIYTSTGKQYRCRHIAKPESYVENTTADISTLSKYYEPSIDIEEGIKRLVTALEGRE